MPIKKSAKKALRQNIKRRAKNIKRKTELKSVIKQYKKLVAEYKKAEPRSELRSVTGEDAKKFLPQVYKKLDKAAKTNLIKKNKASRLKSRLSKLVK
ncbi:30S ribosomal protein S20 [Candidatus Wolfebacteria bacterium]|nr:30S ribosomal protein S20 [Candidatus Wolfebacteria bacterium]